MNNFNRFACFIILSAFAQFFVFSPALAQNVVLPSSAAVAQRAQAMPLHGHGDYIYTADGRIYYETEGSGPPIFLVAGGPGGSHASFHPWFSQLAAENTVVYFDNIGRGRSDRLGNSMGYTIERDADDIEALRKALGYGKISVLGHSYGGLPALAYALKYPTHVNRLILSDTIHCGLAWQEGTDSINQDASSRFPERWSQLMEMRAGGMKTSETAYETLFTTCTADLYWFDPRNAAKMVGLSDKGDLVNYDIYRAMCGDEPEWLLGGTIRAFDPRARMANLHTPTLICVGRFDRVALPKVAFEIKGLLPADSSTLVVFDASGHRPWVEEPARYFQVLGDFLAGRATRAVAAPPVAAR